VTLRLLFSALAVPYPPTNGQRLRNWSLVKALVAEGHEVTLVTFGEPLDDPTRRALLAVCRDVEVVPLPTGSPLWDRLRALPSARPYGALRHRSAAMAEALRLRLAHEPFDAIICDDIYDSDNMPASPVPVLLNKHDITHVIVERYLPYERNPAKRLYGWLEARKLRRWEAATCARSGRVLAVSHVDLRLLHGACTSARYAYAPNVIDVANFEPAASDDGRTMLYVGSMDWLPNRDAVTFFLREILPRVRQVVPRAEFVVAGRAPASAFLRRHGAASGVRFTGSVPDMRVEIAKAVMCVVPLRIGSGTRLKILEAAAMAKPVVSTSIGAEGLTYQHGHDILIADDPAAFAAAVEGLFRQPARRRTLGLAARQRTEAEYSVEALARAMRLALTTLLEAGPLARYQAPQPTPHEARS